jgi:hypothetical protein
MEWWQLIDLTLLFMLFIFLEISSNMHHTLDNPKALTQSARISVCFGGGQRHQRIIHVVT